MIESEAGKMGFWKNLRYVFSDEFNSWLNFLVKNYNQRSVKNEKNVQELSLQMQQVLDTQGVLEKNASESYQELKEENKAGLEKISSQCEAVFMQCEAIYSEMGKEGPKEEEPKLTVQDIEKVVGDALLKQKAESAQRSQILSARIREVYALIEAQNAQNADEPDVGELLSRIEALEKENEDYKNQLATVQDELGQVKEAQLAAEKSYKDEKRKTFDLSKRLVQADDKIQDLISRVKDKDLENMLRKQDSGNPFLIVSNKDKYLVTAANTQVVITRFANTAVLDSFFENVSDRDPYKNMYNRYQKNIRSVAGRVNSRADISDILNVFVSVVQEDLVNKIIESVYRRMKSTNAEFEEKLLAAVNQYLESVGFYCRDSIEVGGTLKDEDFEDMECMKDERPNGRQKGEITEIELYPYYLNYVGRDGRRRKAHTKGVMTVVG